VSAPLSPYSPGADVITRIRAPLTTTGSRYGKETRDWANAARVDIAGASVQPYGTAAEMTVDREYTSTHLRLFAPAGTDLDAADRIEWRGTSYEIDGEPMAWYDDAGVPDHVEAAIKKTEG
jgi:head-tail adaptor